MIPSAAQLDAPSPFRRLLLTDYYDGPRAGLAIDADGAVWVFEFLDWDDRRDMRVFHFAVVPEIRTSEVEVAFGFTDAEEWEFWVVPVPLPPLAEALLQRAESSARPVAVVAATDLLKSIDVWRPITARPSASPGEGWLESLGLRRDASDS